MGTRCEIKNVNSVRSLGRAIEYEARRQIVLLEAGEVVHQETRHWDETDGRTHTLRSKEDADDYRYFLEPDLVPLDPDPAWIERVRSELPMLPAARRERLADATGSAPASEAVMVVVDRGQDFYVLAVRDAGGDPARALVHVKEAFAEQGAEPAVPVSAIAKLTLMEVDGTLTSTQVKQVLADLVAGEGDDPAAIAAARGFEAIDTSSLEAMVDEAIAAQPDAWDEVPRRRGQGGRRVGRRRDEGVQGPGRRQGRHRHPPLPPRLSTPAPTPLRHRPPRRTRKTVTKALRGRSADALRRRKCGGGEAGRDRDGVGVSRREWADDRSDQHVGGRERTEIGPVDELGAEGGDDDRELAAGDQHRAGSHPTAGSDTGPSGRDPPGGDLGDPT